jgi:hypothetical protein
VLVSPLRSTLGVSKEKVTPMVSRNFMWSNRIDAVTLT